MCTLSVRLQVKAGEQTIVLSYRACRLREAQNLFKVDANKLGAHSVLLYYSHPP